jgi:hypothetical protein
MVCDRCPEEAGCAARAEQAGVTEGVWGGRLIGGLPL